MLSLYAAPGKRALVDIYYGEITQNTTNLTPIDHSHFIGLSERDSIFVIMLTFIVGGSEDYDT